MPGLGPGMVGPPASPVAAADGSTLRLRGLPYAAGVDEITSFFEGALEACVMACKATVCSCMQSAHCQPYSNALHNAMGHLNVSKSVLG